MEIEVYKYREGLKTITIDSDHTFAPYPEHCEIWKYRRCEHVISNLYARTNVLEDEGLVLAPLRKLIEKGQK